jgi:hypothetical protein
VKTSFVALSTCDTEKWTTIQTRSGMSAQANSGHRASSSHYEVQDASRQREGGDHLTSVCLRQRQRRLTREQVARIGQQYQEGATLYKIAAEFSIDRKTVSAHLKAAGIKIRLHAPSSEEADKMVRLYLAGLSCATIGAQLRYSPQTVLRRLKDRGVQMRGAHEWRQRPQTRTNG